MSRSKESVVVKHVCDKDVEIALIQQLQRHQSQKIDEIHHAIMGNGKPGMRSEMDQLKGALKLTQIIFTVAALIVSIAALLIK